MADLRDSVAAWWQKHVAVNSLAEAEEAALALSRVLAQAMLEVGVAALGERATYAGPHLPCPCGRAARFVNYRPRWIQTRCGAVRVSRGPRRAGLQALAPAALIGRHAADPRERAIAAAALLRRVAATMKAFSGGASRRR